MISHGQLKCFACVASIAGILVVSGISTSARLGNAFGQEPAQDAPNLVPGSQEIVRRVRFLESEIQVASEDIKTFDKRMPPLEEQLKQLVETVDSVQPPKKKEAPPPSTKNPRRVEYRPPLEKLSRKKDLTFVCADGRVIFLDFKALNESIRQQIGDKNPGTMNVDVSLPGGDFRVKGSFNNGKFGGEVIRNSAISGESTEHVQAQASKFRSVLSANGPTEYNVNFVVYPDSYEIFRAARSIAWQARFEVGWDPMESGKNIRIGQGPSVSATQ